MNIAPLLLAAVLQFGPIDQPLSGPCSIVGWLYCTIPWDIPVFPWVPEVLPVDVDLEPADDVEGPALDSLPELTAPDLIIPEDLDLAVPEFPPAEAPGEEEEDITEQVELWLSPITSIKASLEAWLGDEGALPDASGGDFGTGFDPIEDEHGSAFVFAANLGTNIAELFGYARALSVLTTFGIGTIILFMLACAAWLVLNRFIIFALSVADMLWSILAQGIQALGEALPWPW